jgi:hypothetical protein
MVKMWFQHFYPARPEIPAKRHWNIQEDDPRGKSSARFETTRGTGILPMRCHSGQTATQKRGSSFVENKYIYWHPTADPF